MKKNFMDIGLIYFIGQFLIKGISFLLIPIYSKYLGAEIYGELAIIDIFLSIFSIICTFSIQSGYIRFYDQDIDGKGLSTAFNFSIVTILCYGIIICFIGKFFPYDSLGLHNGYLILLFIFFRGSIEQLIVLLESIYSMEYRVKKIITLRLVITVLSLGLIIYMVVCRHKTIIGIYSGWIIGQLPILIYLIWDNRQRLKFIFDIKLFKKMSSFSFGLLLGNMSYLILSMIDRLFLKEYKTFTDVGVYSMGYKFGVLFEVFFIYSFKKMFTPFKFKEYKSYDFEEKVNKFYLYYTILGVVICLFISVNIKWILDIFTTREFLKAYTITPLIVMSYLFYGYTEFYTIGIHLSNKSYISSIVIFIGGFINTIANFYLIKNFGMYGAAISTIISYLIMNIIYFNFSQKMFYICFNILSSVKIILIGIIFYFLYLYISVLNLNIIIDLTLGNMIGLIYSILLYKYFTPLDIKKEIKIYINIKLKMARQLRKNI